MRVRIRIMAVLLSVLVLGILGTTQNKLLTPGDFVVTGSGTPSLGVNFAYTFNRLYPTEAVPARIVWYWGDERSAKEPRSYTEYSWEQGQRVYHDYPDTRAYDVMVVVSDAKGFFLREQRIQIKLSKPVQVCPCDP